MLEDVGALVVGDRLGTQAVDRDQRAVDGPDHVGDADRLGLAGEAPATGLAALGDHHTGPAQVREDGLEEAVRDVLEAPELLGTHR